MPLARSRATLVLWIVWTLQLIVSVLFVILALVTFSNLAQVQNEDSAGYPGKEIDGALAGSFIAAVLVAALGLLSFFVLVRKTWVKRGAGLSYGFLDASYLNQGCLLILYGIVLTSNSHWTSTFEMSTFWSSSSTNAYVGTYVLAFVGGPLYLLMAIVLILCKPAVQSGNMMMDEVDARLRTTALSNLSPASTGVGPPSPEPSRPPYTTGGAWSPNP